MSNYKITVTGDLIGVPVTCEEVEEYVRGAEAHLVPGVYGWDKVIVTKGGEVDANQYTLTAELSAEDTVTDSMAGYNGQDVSEGFVTSYILGADDSWLRADDGWIFSPVSVQMEDMATA